MGTLTAERSVEIEAPLERCYEIVADLESTPDWQDSMIALEVLERDGRDRPTLCEITSDAKVRHVKSRYRFAHLPPDRMTWEQEKGDLKWLTGEWKLEDLGESRTRATYRIEGDPGRILGLLLRGPVEAKVSEFLTKDSTEGLKRAAESG
jgi:ribosome-associated toxin RatA of RatAB toxin-antitoxin module